MTKGIEIGLLHPGAMGHVVGGLAVRAEGSFFEMPHPVMRKQAPDDAQLRDKMDWVARHLAPFGRVG